MAAPTLLAVAGDNEQRVVDADGQPEHRDDVGDEDEEVECPAEDRRHPKRHDDRDRPQDQRQAGREQRREYDHQHDQGDRNPDRLALSEVLLGHPVVGVVTADGTDGEDIKSGLLLLRDRRQIGVGMLGRLAELTDEVHRNQRRLPIGRDQSRRRGVAVGLSLVVVAGRGDDAGKTGQGVRRLLDQRAERGVVHRRRVRADDHRFGDRGERPQTRHEEIVRAHRLRLVGQRHLGRQGTAQSLRRETGKCEGNSPEREYAPGMKRTNPGKTGRGKNRPPTLRFRFT
jgi:hypothetical protein